MVTIELPYGTTTFVLINARDFFFESQKLVIYKVNKHDFEH